eukprot:Trichotokara_eunicae@DN7587_c0_g1_i1.p1
MTPQQQNLSSVAQKNLGTAASSPSATFAIGCLLMGLTTSNKIIAIFRSNEARVALLTFIQEKFQYPVIHTSLAKALETSNASSPCELETSSPSHRDYDILGCMYLIAISCRYARKKDCTNFN